MAYGESNGHVTDDATWPCLSSCVQLGLDVFLLQRCTIQTKLKDLSGQFLMSVSKKVKSDRRLMITKLLTRKSDCRLPCASRCHGDRRCSRLQKLKTEVRSCHVTNSWALKPANTASCLISIWYGNLTIAARNEQKHSASNEIPTAITALTLLTPWRPQLPWIHI